MKKIGIITIIDLNLGNRLQNYALQRYLQQLGYDVRTIVYTKRNLKAEIKRILKNVLAIFSEKHNDVVWANFNKRIKWDNRLVKDSAEEINRDYDFFVAGSDQIWNPNFDFISDREFLTFADNKKRVSYAASIGVDLIPQDKQTKYKEYFDGFKAISVRECEAADIVNDLTGKDATVVVDPTMLFSEEEWDNVATASRIKIQKKYIVKYFLGGCSEFTTKSIDKLASEQKLEVFDVIGANGRVKKNVGPAEFVWLIKNAEYVCTDSFHATVFSILYHKQFFVFERPSAKGYGKMNSRIDTLLNKFSFNSRYISCTEEQELGKFDFICYDNVEKVLVAEREIAKNYLLEALKG